MSILCFGKQIVTWTKNSIPVIEGNRKIHHCYLISQHSLKPVHGVCLLHTLADSEFSPTGKIMQHLSA